MTFCCGISGVAPEDPVVSKTGFIFERRLVEQYIEDNRKCPITSEPLEKDDLIEIKKSFIAKPRLATTASIPGLLSTLQNEWDDIITEMFQLRQHIETVRSQLSHSLYQHDAACRVIARLLKERDSARAVIIELQKQVSSVQSHGGPMYQDTGINPQFVDHITQNSELLMAKRKQRQVASMIPTERPTSFKCDRSFSLHSTTTQGVNCVAIDNRPDAALPSHIATGGNDGVIVVFDMEKETTCARLTGHLKKINEVLFYRDSSAVVAASDDKTIRIWSCGGFESTSYQPAHVMRKHSSEVISISTHPVEDYLVSCAKEPEWCLHDIASGRTIATFSLDFPYNAIHVHPDGRMVAGAGSNGCVEIWDLRNTGQGTTGTLNVSTKPVTSLQFSENGYYFVTTSEDNTLKLWDLRKSLCFQDIDMTTQEGVQKAVFDYSGMYVAGVHGSRVGLRYFEEKLESQHFYDLIGHEANVTDVKFGAKTTFVVTSSKDRYVKIWRPTKSDDMTSN